jgi:hypothetical protein
MELKLIKGFDMLNLAHNTYLEIKRSWFLIFVVVLAFFGALLTTWMDIVFFYEHYSQWFLNAMLFVLGGMLGIGKFLFGLVAVFAQAPLERKLRKLAVAIFLFLSIVSLVVGFSIFDERFKARKAIVKSSIAKMQVINKSIEDRTSVLESLILAQKIDLENHYLTRSRSYNAKISLENNYLIRAESYNEKIDLESSRISELLRTREKIKGSDLSFLPVLDMYNSMIPLGLELWQKIITVLFGIVLDLAGFFLLYLIFEVSKESVPFRSNVVNIGASHKRSSI